MKIKRYSNRTECPCFFDLSFHFKPAGAKWYGRLARIGDKAAIYTHLYYWRQKNPNTKLIIPTDNIAHETHWSRQLDNEWLFKDIADEIWFAERGNEPFECPPGLNLYNQQYFCLWAQLAKMAPLHVPLQLPQDVKTEAQSRLKRWGVPARYAVVSPLLDAHYDKHRNIPPAWWTNVISILSRSIPVVIIGDAHSMQTFPVSTGLPNIYPLFNDNLTPMQSLAIIQGAAVYLGGETGMTLWAGLFKVPVVAAYAFWDTPWAKNARRGMETRPISFGAPVKWGCPGGGYDVAVRAAESIARRG